jgi:hypothetical protein
MPGYVLRASANYEQIPACAGMTGYAAKKLLRLLTATMLTVALKRNRFLVVDVFPHTDRFSVFIIQFAVQKEAVFFIKGKKAGVMFDIRIYRKKTAGTIAVIAITGY